MKLVKDYYSELIFNKINDIKSAKNNLIFVMLGQSSLVDLKNKQDFIADEQSFYLDANDTVFNKEWFSKVFLTLTQSKEYHLLSFAQFSYLINYIEPSFLIERVIIIEDNLRRLFPIDKTHYFETNTKENIELRPDMLPIYQAEQIVVNHRYYYSLKKPVLDFNTEVIFTQTVKLEISNNEKLECIDVSSDQYSFDIFVNECILENNFKKNVVVKFYKKQPLNSEILDKLMKLNSLMNYFGGTLYLLEETSIKSDFRIENSTLEALVKFWGKNATFRNMLVYDNPNIGNQTIEVSQGLIVETIINEYENSLNDIPCRDLFLTAPTGAGKSLLFQLPAFYISSKGAVTIVVSPLIALMKDQVNAIIQDRNYEKVAYLNSELSLIDRERIIESCKGEEIDILYLSPELLLSYDITHFIGSRKIGLLVIDEAHLITTWGRDFRVDYWFLGNHIRKIRKFHNVQFPMVAVTATAIYGGENDMVFDTIDSLVMHNPHIFIGQVKRNDIEFLVNNYERFTANYESNKINQTVEFLRKINELELKTLVYAPYTKHIRLILNHLNSEHLNIATGYYGTLDIRNKEYSYRQFKSGERNIMISTKAFGMGIDISDIQVVYHHAPSGLLPDYVQEIGRVARKPGLLGFAALNYSSQDQRYTKALHGISALRQYQLREVLKKIHKSYLKNYKNKNLLLSVDDFGHIFENAIDLDQKVLTALMMIEKDYLSKNRFNVIIARPKKLFVKVFARITDIHLNILSVKYSSNYRFLYSSGNGNSVIELDLDKLWNNYYVNKSFPVLKRDFYTGKLFEDINIELIPQLKISFELLDNFSSVFKKLQSLLNSIQSIFADISGFFKQQIFQDRLNVFLQNNEKSDKISKFILSSYSGRVIQQGVIESHAFLQERRSIDGFEYRVFNTQYLASFTALLNRLKILFEGCDDSVVDKYVTNKEINTINYVRLGYFLEMLDLGTFEIKGGENPMIFIRINDPQRIERDSNNPNYTNTLLSKTLQRHYLSNQIFDHFFLRSFTNSERWNFIEEFFLGLDVDSLLQKYKGSDSNNIDIIELLKAKELIKGEISKNLSEDTNIHIFPPSENRTYGLKDLLTIENGNIKCSMRISEWILKDPVSFDKCRRKSNLKLNHESYDLLKSKLKANHPEYFRDILGLNARIKFKGYDKEVKAIIPYSENPVEFYKWWCENQNSITMNIAEKIKLYDKVSIINPNVLKREHRNLLK